MRMNSTPEPFSSLHSLTSPTRTKYASTLPYGNCRAVSIGLGADKRNHCETKRRSGVLTSPIFLQSFPLCSFLILRMLYISYCCVWKHVANNPMCVLMRRVWVLRPTIQGVITLSCLAYKSSHFWLDAYHIKSSQHYIGTSYVFSSCSLLSLNKGNV